MIKPDGLSIHGSSGEGGDPYRLKRFVDAQAPVFETVSRELLDGEKRSHWMWYIFPQIQGLGRSAIAQEFAISSLDEARAYLAHPVLRERLLRATHAVLRVEGKSAHAIFGSPDDLKFHSSMTLFAQAAVDPDRQVFLDALHKYFKGRFDQATLDRMA